MKGEVAVRSQLLSAMAEQQNLMDALTAVSLLVMCTCMHIYMCTCMSATFAYNQVLMCKFV